ncbi:hypothetical protein T492DRAFT_965423 [Pavlovales sp. CCMP2436]|nr:hypothetical protein T492DRAFT_965423 [Pavlovales sp. CCMP2436]
MDGTHYLKQKPKGVCLELMGCQQENEWGIGSKLGGWSLDGDDSYYLDERATLCCRCCLGAQRQTELTLSIGGKPGGVPIATFHRPFKLSPTPCKCCCFQQMHVKDMAGADVGLVTELFWCCVPKYMVVSADGSHLYDFHQSTCCAGTCVNCCDSGGAGCCKVPFYFYPPAGGEEARDGKMIKVWLGLKKECCTLANTIEIEAPMGARSGEKLALVYAAATLLDFNFFENRQE